MARSFRQRLEVLERLEAQAEIEARALDRPPPPTFDEALAGVALFRAALADGRARVCRSAHTWQNGVAVYASHLCHMPDPEVCRWGIRISNWRTRLGGAEFTTVAEWDAWLGETGEALAFLMSRTDDELDTLAARLADEEGR